MTDDAQQIRDIPRGAASLAALIHIITLTSPGVSQQTGRSLRTTSKLLYDKLSDPSERRLEPGASTSGEEVLALATGILKELSSPESSTGIPEKERAFLVDAYRNLLKSLQSAQAVQHTENGIPHSAHQGVFQSLRGKVILITRPESQSQKMREAVEQYGGLPVVFPLIEILDPDEWDPVDHAIANLKGYDGVIFTSQNGVERFLGRISSVNAAALKVLATRRVYAVGSQTRTSLENAQIPVTLMPDRFSAKDLISSLQKEPLAGKRFLFPKGSLAGEEIPEALRASHAVVDEIEVYKTAGPAGASFDALDLALQDGEIDALTFFSPSAVQNLTRSVRAEHARKSVVACVGPSTADAAASAGFSGIITAPEATAESLIGALVRYFNR